MKASEQFQLRKEQNRQKLLKQQEKRELANCTFQPTVRPAKTKRSLTQFLNEQSNFEKNKQLKLKNLRAQQALQQELSEKSSYTPSLCTKSVQLSQRHGSVFEKLYTHSRLTTSVSQASFAPQVNQKSKNLIRNQPVDVLLYRDALRRIQKEQPVQMPNKVKISEGSQKWLKDKLERDFNLETQDEIVNYTIYRQLMQNMGFISNDHEDPRYGQEKTLVIMAWELITQEGDLKVSRQNLLVFLQCVMGLYQGSDILSAPAPSMGQVVEGIFLVSDTQAQRIHKFFSLFYQNRVQAFSKTRKEEESLSFRPVLEANSRNLASEFWKKRTGVVPVQDRLMMEKKERQERLQLKRLEKIEAETFSFRPSINQQGKKEKIENRHEALFSLSKTQRLPQKTSIEVQIQRQLAQCTFKPQISSHQLLRNRQPLYNPKKSLVGSPSSMDHSITALPKQKSCFSKTNN